MSKVDSKQVEAYYEQYPPGTEVEVYYQRQWQSAKVIKRYHKGKGRTVYIEVDTDAGVHLFFSYGSRRGIHQLNPLSKISLQYVREDFIADKVFLVEKEYGYAEALANLESWGDLSKIGIMYMVPAQVAALEKARQALRDCLELGLSGEGFGRVP